MSAEYYGVDLSKLSEDEKGAVCEALFHLQETPCELQNDGNLGVVYGTSGTVESLQKEGWDVKLIEGVR